PGCGGRYVPRLHDTESPKNVIRGCCPGWRPGRSIGLSFAAAGAGVVGRANTGAAGRVGRGTVATTATRPTATTQPTAVTTATDGRRIRMRPVRIGCSITTYEAAAIAIVAAIRTNRSATPVSPVRPAVSSANNGQCHR